MTEPVVLHHGRQEGRIRSRRGAAICCNGRLGGAAPPAASGIAQAFGTGMIGTIVCSMNTRRRIRSSTSSA
jgi:hypothetical protein